MEKFEALVDLVRTLSKRCEQFEQYKEKERIRVANDEIERLKTILDNAGIEY